MKATFLLASLLMASVLGAQAPSVAGGFALDVVLNPVVTGRAFAFSPDGRLFYTEHSTGQIMVVTNPTTTPGAPTVFATVSGYVGPTSNDCGLHGIVFDPAFPASTSDPNNRYIYVAHTTGTAGAPQLVVKRFTENVAALGTALGGSETAVVPAIAMGSATGTNLGGRLRFGPDGKLYVGVGDGGAALAIAGAAAQSTTSSLGKVLRYNSNGSVPVDNPVSLNPYWARGLRNPRGLAFNPSTNDLFATDNGNPPTGADELNVGVAAGNYGWDTTGTSGTQVNPAYNNPALVLPADFEPSGIAFHPSSGGSFPAAGYRAGCLYLGCENTAASVTFPVVGAKAGAMVVRVVLSGGNERTAVGMWPLVTSFTTAVRDLAFGPDNHLYILTDTVLYRLRYTGNTSVNAPVAVAGVDQTVNEGAPVTLNGAGSSDADAGDVLRYTWRQIGGSTVVSLTNATTSVATFTAPSVPFTQNFTFELLVEDGNGGVASDVVLVTVNDVGGGGGGGDSDKELLEAPGEGGCAAHLAGGALALWLLPLALWRRRRRA
ncbi:MAG: PQQ-dependent sugar dehydrogenase [Planctomycetes bacterium]|nr:PQQ-dependent sugar dehydrogenase [Planctomycetota bacterium]